MVQFILDLKPTVYRVESLSDRDAHTTGCRTGTIELQLYKDRGERLPSSEDFAAGNSGEEAECQVPQGMGTHDPTFQYWD